MSICLTMILSRGHKFNLCPFAQLTVHQEEINLHLSICSIDSSLGGHTFIFV